MDSISYESREGAKLVGVPERMLRYWATIRAMAVDQDAVGRPGVRRRYSFRNLVEAAILRELSKHGVSIPVAREAVARVREKGYGEEGFCYLIIWGRDVDVVTPQNLESEAKFAKFKVFTDIKDRLGTRLEPEQLKQIAQLGTYILSTGESFFVIPVNSLWKELDEKVRAGG